MIPAATLFEPMPIKAVGATLRAARFEPAPDVPARGVCVLLNGQTEFIEKYFEVIDELRGRGFAVATMDWRGQGDSGRMTTDSRKSFVGDFSEYDQDLDTLMDWIVTPMLEAGEKPVALAHSLGAHVLLRALVKRPQSFKACALSAPMIAISFRGQREFLVRAVTRYHIWRGQHAGWCRLTWMTTGNGAASGLNSAVRPPESPSRAYRPWGPGYAERTHIRTRQSGPAEPIRTVRPRPCYSKSTRVVHHHGTSQNR